MRSKRDLSGERFGRLVVLKPAGQKNAKWFWLCRCDCGQRPEIRADQLTRGVAKSCGCLQRETARDLRLGAVSQKTVKLRTLRARRTAKGLPSNLGIRDLTGRRFGRLKVTKFAGIKNQQSLWHCNCSCGMKTIVTASRLNYGWTKSCGCLQLERGITNRLRHGHTANRQFSPEYQTWNSMKTRCLNPNTRSYKDYGGRGITICKRWLDSFEAFLADMGPETITAPQH